MKLIKTLNEAKIDVSLFPIFFQENWLAYEEKNKKFTSYIYFDETKNFFVPFKIYKKWVFNKADYIYVPLNKNGERLSVEDERSFINRFHIFLKFNKICDAIFPPPHYCNFKCIPEKCFYYEIGILTVDLLKNENEIFGKINAENRRQIRKAEKSKVEIFWGNEYLKDFYESYLETKAKKNIAIDSFDHMKDISERFKNNCVIGIAKFNNNIEASVFDIKDNNYAYSFYSGTSQNILINGSKKYLIWNDYLKLKNNNIKKYFLGGYRLLLNKKNKLFNVQDFKRGLGCDIEYGYQFIKIISPFKYNIMMFLLKLLSLIKRKNLNFINISGLDIKKS